MLGSNVALNDIKSTEIVTRTMDFVWLDMEHGGLSIETVEGHIMMAKKNCKIALVRIPKLDESWIKMVLDAGAHGVIIPQARSAADVILAVELTRYYPMGKRGFGPRIPYRYNEMGSTKEYLEWANKNIYVAIQIETREAYEHLDEILTVEGFDSVCIGPADFSLSMGYYADITCPEMKAILKDVITRTKVKGIDVGFGMGTDLDYSQEILKMGVDWLQVGEDYNYIHNMCEKIYNTLRNRGQN
ncbi:MAG: aldolase/citrate lyase family protein [Actinobacteria bacterium]|nr:aldolase/citrate lyase family protein [Actinomycetota bacterium]